MQEKLIDWRAFLIGLALVGAIALAASFVFGFGFLRAFVATLAALLINGLVATLEDDLPGGFNNPHGTDTPRYARRLLQVARLCTIAGIGASTLVRQN